MSTALQIAEAYALLVYMLCRLIGNRVLLANISTCDQSTTCAIVRIGIAAQWQWTGCGDWHPSCPGGIIKTLWEFLLGGVKRSSYLGVILFPLSPLAGGGLPEPWKVVGDPVTKIQTNGAIFSVDARSF